MLPLVAAGGYGLLTPSPQATLRGNIQDTIIVATSLFEFIIEALKLFFCCQKCWNLIDMVKSIQAYLSYSTMIYIVKFDRHGWFNSIHMWDTTMTFDQYLSIPFLSPGGGHPWVMTHGLGMPLYAHFSGGGGVERRGGASKCHLALWEGGLFFSRQSIRKEPGLSRKWWLDLDT